MYLYIHIYIYIYTSREEPPSLPAPRIRAVPSTIDIMVISGVHQGGLSKGGFGN